MNEGTRVKWTVPNGTIVEGTILGEARANEPFGLEEYVWTEPEIGYVVKQDGDDIPELVPFDEVKEIDMDTRKQVDQKRSDTLHEVNDIINPIVKKLNSMADRAHGQGYHSWSTYLSNVAYKVDAAHHDFVDQMIEEAE